MILLDKSKTNTLKNTYLGILTIIIFANIIAFLASAEESTPAIFFNLLITLLVILGVITSGPTLIKIEYKEEEKQLVINRMNLLGKIVNSKININDLLCKVENFPGAKGSLSTYLCFYDKHVLIFKFYVGSNKIDSSHTILIQKLNEILMHYQESKINGFDAKVLITI
jgi:hypothetical protein